MLCHPRPLHAAVVARVVAHPRARLLPAVALVVEVLVAAHPAQLAAHPQARLLAVALVAEVLVAAHPVQPVAHPQARLLSVVPSVAQAEAVRVVVHLLPVLALFRQFLAVPHRRQPADVEVRVVLRLR